jgi:uncharacterized protein (TIGR03066 family)
MLWGCSKSGALVGKWQGEDPADVMEFRADGTFLLSEGEDMKGTYSFNGKTLKLKLDGELGKALGSMSVPAVVENDTLKMTDEGKVEVYKRVK